MNEIAPEGQVYVCLGCGKRSKDLYGYKPVNIGWDISCMMNCELCFEDKLVLSDSGYVLKVEDGGLVNPPKKENSKIRTNNNPILNDPL